MLMVHLVLNGPESQPQRLLDVDGRFARDLDYLFVTLCIVEAKQVLDDGTNFALRLDNICCSPP